MASTLEVMEGPEMRGEVFAIVRYDEFQDSRTPIDVRVTVTRIVHDEATARAEVKRLNDLNSAKGSRYWFQATRLAEPAN